MVRPRTADTGNPLKTRVFQKNAFKTALYHRVKRFFADTVNVFI